MPNFNGLTDADFQLACADLYSLSGDKDLFYILGHRAEFDAHTLALAEYIDSWDCYRMAGDEAFTALPTN